MPSLEGCFVGQGTNRLADTALVFGKWRARGERLAIFRNTYTGTYLIIFLLIVKLKFFFKRIVRKFKYHDEALLYN